MFLGSDSFEKKLKVELCIVINEGFTTKPLNNFFKTCILCAIPLGKPKNKKNEFFQQIKTKTKTGFFYKWKAL